VRRLADAGWRVRALTRRPADDLPAERVTGDLADEAGLARLCEGAEVLFHVAGLVKARRAGAFAAVNHAGALRAAEAARGAGRVVLVSSLTARAPHLSAYAASKHAAETALAEALGPRLTVVRPPAIYGPGDRELLPVFQAARTSPFLPLLDPAARVAMIHVEDAAAQIAAAADVPGGGVWALSDARPDGYAWRELMTTAAAAVGRRPRLVRAPAGVVRLLGLWGDLLALGGGNPMLRSGKARELLHWDWAISPQEQAAGLPAARYTLAAGFDHTIAWYRTARWLK